MNEHILKGKATKCPRCSKIFDSGDTFQWMVNEDGDPTIESIFCPHCGIGSEQSHKCDWCIGVYSCVLLKQDRVDECAACDYIEYNKWEDADIEETHKYLCEKNNKEYDPLPF